MENTDLLSNFKNKFLSNLDKINFDLIESEVGTVLNVNDYIVNVVGLGKVGFNESVIISEKYFGYVAGMENGIINIVLLDKTNNIKVGDSVKRTRKYVEVPVGEKLIGRVVDGLGRPLDNKGKIKTDIFYQADRPSVGILDRKGVNMPMETGIKIIDCLIPIGKGQKELILGDRQTGKTSIAIDTILNQKGKNVICIYCSIGQRDSSVRNVVNILEKNNAMDYTIIVNANATSSPGMRYITPYSATSMAEYFCERGKSVLIVYDDLSKHAKTYREISLLLGRSPGREAYPGDIFYLHSRLLERSANLIDELGGGNITSLPIVETESENISAYIPTNIISITDGQLYLSPVNFQKGFLPAIDIGKSVSRIGGKAQLKAFKQVAGKIGIEYSQFEELENFSRFATKLDDETKKIIDKGNLIREILKQNKNETVSMEGQVAIFMCVNNNILDNISFDKIKKAERDIVNLMQNDFQDIVKIIKNNNTISQENMNKFLEKAKEVVEKYKNM